MSKDGKKGKTWAETGLYKMPHAFINTGRGLSERHF